MGKLYNRAVEMEEESHWNKNYGFGIIGLVIILFIIYKLLGSNDQWTAIYYPDLDRIDDQSSWQISPTLESLDKCREWVNRIAKGDNWDYTCGKNCRYDPDVPSERIICKEDNK